jgi:putative glutamine amidotransferase
MKIWSILITIILISSCQPSEKLMILVSKDNHGNIAKWIHSIDSTIMIKEFYNLSPDSMNICLSEAKGLILGGGEDVDPKMYGHQEFLPACEEIDHYRDSIEKLMIDYSFQHRIPLLGICRGEQILNAATGGTLIPDIPTFTSSKINHRVSGNAAHWVIFPDNSWLKSLKAGDSLFVNSHHHQCIDKVAPAFTIAAWSTDHLVESIRYSDTLKEPFIAGVQWHPEGLLDDASIKIGKKFLSYCRK